MKCIFCHKDVLAKDKLRGHPITLPGRGVSHSGCAEDDLIKRRIFGSIHLKDLEENDLYELRELVLAEINERLGLNSDEPDLF